MSEKIRIDIYPKKEAYNIARILKEEYGITFSKIFEIGVLALQKIKRLD